MEFRFSKLTLIKIAILWFHGWRRSQFLRRYNAIWKIIVAFQLFWIIDVETAMSIFWWNVIEVTIVSEFLMRYHAIWKIIVQCRLDLRTGLLHSSESVFKSGFYDIVTLSLGRANILRGSVISITKDSKPRLSLVSHHVRMLQHCSSRSTVAQSSTENIVLRSTLTRVASPSFGI
jgi:hypothetical protein